MQLDCNEKTNVTKLLDVWPTLPISLRGDFYLIPRRDDIIAKLQHRDRIVKIDLSELGDPLLYV
jgi:hypothetical protein